ncbi:MAG: toprim domain-containing protein [Candidatus Njordarchaeia archaeon]
MRQKSNGINASRFWRIWVRVIDIVEEGGCIIVEGLKDKHALEKLMFGGEIITLQEMGIENAIERAKTKSSVIILTDFDREGDKLAKLTEKRLVQEHVRLYSKIREELRKVLTPIRQVEDIKNVSDYLIDNAPFKLYLKFNSMKLGINM